MVDPESPSVELRQVPQAELVNAPEPDGRRLTAPEFFKLGEMPAEEEWFANIDNENTRRAYKTDIKEFIQFLGLSSNEELKLVQPAHIIAFRKYLRARPQEPNRDDGRKALGISLHDASVRRKLAAVSSLYKYLIEKQVVAINPTKGVPRPKKSSTRINALSEDQARLLMEQPAADTLQGKRDSSILVCGFWLGLRRIEISRLTPKCMVEDQGELCLAIHGKGDEMRLVPLGPIGKRKINDYLETAGHGDDLDGPLFRSLKPRKGFPAKPLHPDTIYLSVVKRYAKELGYKVSPHTMRHTAGTNALNHGADVGEVGEWLGHKDISTTQKYDHRNHLPENSPTYKIDYSGRKKNGGVQNGAE